MEGHFGAYSFHRTPLRRPVKNIRQILRGKNHRFRLFIVPEKHIFEKKIDFFFWSVGGRVGGRAGGVSGHAGKGGRAGAGGQVGGRTGVRAGGWAVWRASGQPEGAECGGGIARPAGCCLVACVPPVGRAVACFVAHSLLIRCSLPPPQAGASE